MNMRAEVHFFKQTGKWYCMERITFSEPWDTSKDWDYADYTIRAIRQQIGGRLSGLLVVITDAENTPWGFPVMVVGL